jgi:hypothetical protein
MANLKKVLFALGFLVLTQVFANAQDFLLRSDSLRELLQTRYARLSAERIRIVKELLSRALPGEPTFDSLQNALIQQAEESRDRFFLCMTYEMVADAYLSYYQKSEYYEKGKVYADKCMQIATESGLNNFKVAALLSYAQYDRSTTQFQKALDYNNQAISLASSMESDSLLSVAYSSIADTWELLSNKLSEFQALINQREFAEKSRIPFLINDSYLNLGRFYEETNDYEKAKDFYTLSLERARLGEQRTQVFLSLIFIGQVFLKQKMEALGILYYNRAQQYIDSLGIPNLKLRIYFDVLNYYFNNQDPGRGIAYLKSHPELTAFIQSYGISYQLNKLYAEVQNREGRYDSALYFLRIAAPFEYGQKANYREKYNFSLQLASVLKRMDKLGEEKKFLLLAKEYADSSQDLNHLKEISLELDSFSMRIRNAQTYLQQYNIYKDSLESLARQRDVLNIEIENTNKRAEQQKLAEAESKRLRNNVEYLGITAALATVFIILVILGVFKISPGVIRALGFFAFIFLFEFIVLLLDTQIHELTGGEPWKVLGVKIVIIAMLLPLHHWLEERMLHYLTHKAHHIKPKIFDKKQGPPPGTQGPVSQS